MPLRATSLTDSRQYLFGEHKVSIEARLVYPVDTASPMTLPRISTVLTAMVFVASLLASLGLWNYAHRNAANDLQAEFDFHAHETIKYLEERMATYIQVLYGVRALFIGTDQVTRDQFHAYISSLRLGEQYPGIQGLSHAPLIPHERKAEHVATMRQQGFPEYDIKPSGEREYYTPVIYIEPFSGPNREVLGYDTYFEAERHTAMALARDADRAVVSGKLTLIQETEEDVQSGFLVFLPLYQKGVPNQTLEQRRKHITGWVTAVFRVGDLMASLGDRGAAELAIEIYDGETISDESKMYPSPIPIGNTGEDKIRLTSIRRVALPDRVWTVVIHSTPVFETHFSNNTPTVVALTGIAFTLLLTLLAHALVRSSRIAHELAQSEERWRFALEGAGDGVWDWNIQSNVVQFSRRWKQMLGFDDNEILNNFSEWEKRVHPDDLERALSDIHEHLDGRTRTYVNEHRMLHKDGAWRWILDRGMVTSRSEDGKPLRMIGTHADITKRKQSEDHIQRLTQLYSTLSHCDQAIVHSANQDELFPQICQAAVESGGFKMAWIGELNDADQAVIPVARFGEGTEYLDNVVITAEPDTATSCGPACTAIREDHPVWYQDSDIYPITTTWKLFSQEYGWRSSAAIPLHKNGQVVAIFNLYAGDVNAFDEDAKTLLLQMAADISFALDNFAEAMRRKQAEDELINLNATLESRVRQRTDELVNAKELADAASQAKSDFLSNMSHEIRTPLTAIVGFAEALLANDFSKKEHKKITTAIVRNGKHLQQIIDDILDLSKIEAGQLELEKISTPLFALIEEIDSMLGVCARDKGLDFRINYHFPLPTEIETDPTSLKQILINLISNAIKFTVEGYVHVDIRCDDDYRNIYFVVADSGIGMTHDETEHVFDPFMQADSTTTRQYGGTGLGLSISSKLAIANGGKLSCVSEKGKGSRFTLVTKNNASGDISVLNSMEEAIADDIDHEYIEIRALSGKILLVEDNQDNQQLISMYVKRTGAMLDIAENGQAGVEKALTSGYDLILMDMQMPVLDGLQAIKVLRDRGYDKPIVSLTANAMLSSRQQCLDAGANGYLVKPIDLAQFYDSLNKYLSETPEPAEAVPGQEISEEVHRKSADFYNSNSYLEIVERFKQKLPGMVAELSEAVQAENWDVVQSKSHDLKGLGGTLGLHEITDVAGRINVQVKEKAYDRVALTSTELEKKSQSILQ